MSRPSEATMDAKARQYFAVPIHTYKEGDVIDQPLYFLYEGQYILFQEKGRRWVQDDSTKLENFGISELYTKFDHESQWHEFMDNKMQLLLDEPQMSVQEKARIVYMTSVSSANAVFQNPKSPEAAQRSVSFVKHCIDYLNQDSSAFYELFSTSAQNMAEHSHGLHVAAYSVTLAKHLGHKEEKDLLALGVGAVLHDIGKTKIDRALLEKPGKPTREEMELLKKHTTFGYEIANHHSVFVPDLARKIVWQHHERIDGSGYPKGLVNIPIFSQIVGIVDVFDAMTSHRPYKAQTRSVDTLMEMLQMNKGGFDRNLLIAFIEMMKQK
jgi:putative nucleotidyltransferase with HDIG domain